MLKVNVFVRINRRLKYIFRKPINKISMWFLKRNYSLLNTTFDNYKTQNINYNFNDNLVFMDENCLEVIEQFNFSELEVPLKKYEFLTNNSFEVFSRKSDGENWCIFVWEIVLDEYEFEFDFILQNQICEVQLAFNYFNLRNRNRFLILENKRLAFDLIKNSHFYPIIYEKEFENILKIGISNHVKIIKKYGEYNLEINGNKLFCVSEQKKLLKGNKIAFILWEDTHNRSIECTVKNLSLRSIVREEKMDGCFRN